MIFRLYQINDQAACLEIFDSNCPKFFAPNERQAFITDLSEFLNYFVLEKENQIVACGGLEQIRTGIWVLCWGMVQQDLHHQGFGKALLEYRLAWLKTQPIVHELHLDTTPLSSGFFAKYGFEIVQVTPNGYAIGLDRVDMVLKLLT